MLKKVGELKVDKQKDYYGKQVKALEEYGFTVMLEHEDFGTAYYAVAHEDVQNLDDLLKEGDTNDKL